MNFRRLLRDIAGGGILGCMMSVPSIGWNAARDNGHPLRSHSEPWGFERSRAFLCPSDLACLDSGNRIMRAVITLARQCHRFKVPWAIEHPHNSLCWSTPQLTQLANMRDVHEITFDFCAFGTTWRKRATVLAGHVDAADMYSLNKMRCYGRTRCTFTNESTCSSWITILLINVHVQTKPKPIRRSWQPDLHTCFWDPPSPPENVLRFGHAMGQVTRPTVQSLYCAVSTL